MYQQADHGVGNRLINTLLIFVGSVSLTRTREDVGRASVTLPAGTRIFRVRLGYRANRSGRAGKPAVLCRMKGCRLTTLAELTEELYGRQCNRAWM